MTLSPKTVHADTASPFPVGEHVCRVVSNEAVNDQYRLMELAAPAPALTAEPGQFFHLLCPQAGADAPFFRRPMSIYRIDRVQGRLGFLYKETGSGTRAMATLRPGDDFNIVGPLGIGFSLPPDRAPIVLLARGVGLATLAPLAQAAAAAGNPVTALFSARDPAYLMSLDYMADQGAEVLTVTDSEGTSDPEQVERRLRELHAAGRMEAIYTCGSNRLMLLAQRLANTFAIRGEVAMEQQMACGLGMCFCCVRAFRTAEGIEHRRVCNEGPVFDLKEALSW
ncbi:MAG: dihydroorotate dehydrogenase electron transfer subunit [Azospirillaceae bacterium]